MIKIIIPQAVRNMIPNLMGLYINELKNSSLASIIAVDELLHRSNILISETFRPLEIYTAVAATYLIIILPLTYLSRLFERKLAKGDKPKLGVNYEISY
jgi:polar amino acid transport system permease protein